jgi:cytochrome c-type biogenesis protein CcmF
MIALAVMAREYMKTAPPARFHLIVSPLVMWIWIGGGIVLVGGLIAMWPAPSAIRSRVSAQPIDDPRDSRSASSRAAHGLARA